MRQNSGASATYKELADGSWGVWTDLDCRPGQSITVTTRTGHTKLEKLNKHIGDSGDGKYHLWSIKGAEPPRCGGVTLLSSDQPPGSVTHPYIDSRIVRHRR